MAHGLLHAHVGALHGPGAATLISSQHSEDAQAHAVLHKTNRALTGTCRVGHIPILKIKCPYLQRGGVAAAAGGAVEEVGAAAHAADAARVAVELLLAQVVVEEAAAQARVRAERCAAAQARRPHVLPQPAQRALQLAHRRAVQLVALGRVLRAREAVDNGEAKLLRQGIKKPNCSRDAETSSSCRLAASCMCTRH